MEKNEFAKDFHKRNRKLAYSAVGTPDYVAPEVQGKRIIFLTQLDTLKRLIGGRWELFCLKCSLGTLHSHPKLQEKPGIKYKTGESI